MPSSFRIAGVLICSAVLVFFLTPLSAQRNTATLSGTVLDPEGATVRDVKISLVNLSTNARHQAVTDKNGRFLIARLEPGKYKLHTSGAGFAIAELNEIELKPKQRSELVIRLKVQSGESQGKTLR